MEILQSRSTTQDETLSYFVNKFNGEIRLSPDNRIHDPRKLGWNPKEWGYFEAKTAREKDAVSARMAEQLWTKKRSMKVQQVLREQSARETMKASARLRLVQSPTQLDYLCNQKIIARLEQDEDRLYRELTEEFSNANRTSGLEMEWASSSTSYWGNRGEKQAGVTS